MIYVFDTSALCWLFDNAADANWWMPRIPNNATIFYHPITLAEIAAQTHEEYVLARNARLSTAQAAATAANRRALVIGLSNPSARPVWMRRNFRPFDTGTRATKHVQPSVYAQLQHERLQRQHLYRTVTGEIHLMASMVDHMILSVATFLHHDGAQLAAFVTRDRQQYEAAARARVPKLYASRDQPRPTGGTWIG